MRTLCGIILAATLNLAVLSGCVAADTPAGGMQDPAKGPSEINSFADCVAAGFPIMRTFPPRCRTSDGRIFVDQTVRVPSDSGEGPTVPLQKDGPINGGGCENRCGDGVCQEIVCMAIGCPCSESPATCPSDCKAR